MDQSISLNKFISDTGYCSRREADKLITSGRVLLNDRPASLGNRYKPGDTVEVDGSLITAAKKEKCVYLALNKPPGITTTTELHIKDNIISFVNYPKRIFPIGRLDKDSEGLIFLTNDGDIINKILRAANNHEKEYIVKVDKAIDTAFLDQMSKGVPILDTRTLPCKVQMMGRQTFRITLTQGLNRQIRRMCEYLGYEVIGLQRVRIMNVKLDKLPLGKWRHLTETELANLNESIADSSKVNEKEKKAVEEEGFGALIPNRHKMKAGKADGEGKRLGKGKADGESKRLSKGKADGEGKSVGKGRSEGDGKAVEKGKAGGEEKRFWKGRLVGGGKLLGKADGEGKRFGKADGEGKQFGKSKPAGEGKQLGKGKSVGEGKQFGKSKPAGEGKRIGKSKPASGGKKTTQPGKSKPASGGKRTGNRGRR
ncbi:23S rRNA pseudouridine(2604) synthase RluF [Chitinophaga sancti]|uniref:23S rRNA pseudouridine(2604) synthase RluF n=1 Tax=Chitinophaga sancti TaxID=1004 RepID=UPI002A74B73D|nr:23S rRNA pseudouridine(2604) synthase RluF [Chitinophaga sancti]WPQ65854.1 23S rRNA pseudouridine(2604) synthase RluF [Chitinophaga sancti]